MPQKPWLIGLLQALCVAVYCTMVASCMWFAPKTVVIRPQFLGGALMLMLLVFSAAITGALVFGYPVYLALKNEITKALQVLGFTLLFCFLLGLSILSILILFQLYA